MKTIIKTYANELNGGTEKVKKENGEFYINSDWGQGFNGWERVYKSQIEMTLRLTKAPQDIVDAILA